MKRVTFVTGPSCSGKTTVNRALDAQAEGDFYVFDVDDDGTPQAGAVAWLAWRSEELLLDASLQCTTDDVPSIITGIVWPHTVIESTAMWVIDPDIEIHFVMLELSKKELTARLRERLAHTGRPFTPFVDYNWSLQRRLRTQVEHQRNGHILPADKWSPETIVECVKLIATKDSG